MKSRKSSRLIDLSHDLPTSAADVIGLRRARESGTRSFEAYLQFLGNFPAPSREELRRRKGPAGDRPFEL